MLFQAVFVLFCFFTRIESFTIPSDPKIIGGVQVTDRTLLPYQASLHLRGISLFCGASIIHEKYALTAASCVILPGNIMISPADIKVVTGNVLREDRSIMKDVEDYYYHSLFNPSNPTNGYDIALIKIIGSFLPWTTHVFPIALKTVQTISGSCVASGWGTTTPESYTTSLNLMFVAVPVINWQTCNAAYVDAVSQQIPTTAICAGGKGTGVCPGDGGGPLACSGLLAGIASFGNGCGQADVPGVYTEVAMYVDWITNIISPPTTTTSTTPASTTPCITRTTTLSTTTTTPSTTTVTSMTTGVSTTTTTSPTTTDATLVRNIPFCDESGFAVASRESVILLILAFATILAIY